VRRDDDREREREAREVTPRDLPEFRRERVTRIDPASRRVTTDGGTYEPDVLVVALGADYDQAATPGGS